MSRLVFRFGAVMLPLALAVAAAGAGCSESANDDPKPAGDAGLDTATPIETDAGTEAGPFDCQTDKMADGLYRHLSCETLYANIGAKTVGDGNRAYKPANEFWSDGAAKARWLYLPPGAAIDATNPDEWKFPPGTKLWKEFSIDGKRVETRLYTKVDTSAWRHTSYRWTDDGTDAVRNDGNQLVPVAGKRSYEIPNSGQCNDCHNGKSEPVLAVDAVGLGLPGAEGVTLAMLAAEGRFQPALPSTSLELPDDGTTKAAAALGWLHANCGNCHTRNTQGNAFYTNVFFRLRYDELTSGAADPNAFDAVKTTVCKTSSRFDDAGAPYQVIAIGSPETSIASILSGKRAPEGTPPDVQNQMPPIATHVVDTEGHAKLDDWARALTSCPPSP